MYELWKDGEFGALEAFGVYRFASGYYNSCSGELIWLGQRYGVKTR